MENFQGLDSIGPRCCAHDDKARIFHGFTEITEIIKKNEFLFIFILSILYKSVQKSIK